MSEEDSIEDLEPEDITETEKKSAGVPWLPLIIVIPPGVCPQVHSVLQIQRI